MTRIVQWLIERSDYIDTRLLLLANIIPSQIPSNITSYYDGNVLVPLVRNIFKSTEFVL